MFKIRLDLFPREFTGNWWLVKTIEMPFIPTGGTEIENPIKTADDASVDIEVMRCSYNIRDGVITVHCETDIVDFYHLYLSDTDWKFEDDCEAQFLNDEREELEEIRKRWYTDRGIKLLR